MKDNFSPQLQNEFMVHALNEDHVIAKNGGIKIAKKI